ncbi:MAG: DNA methyltransferase [Polyangiaceae bacterium]
MSERAKKKPRRAPRAGEGGSTQRGPAAKKRRVAKAGAVKGAPRTGARAEALKAERPLLRRERVALAKAARAERAGQKPELDTLDPLEPPRQRRALSHVGGKVERLEGDPELCALIEQALAPNPEAGVRDHVHGFHSYPARLHPRTAQTLIEGLSAEGGLVCDPFCGSGTVLVESRRLGRNALGIDLNPLAIQLSLLKTQPPSAEQREQLTLAARRVADHAEERRAAKAGPTRPYSPAERKEFEIHVLLELDGLASGIKEEHDLKLRRVLLLVLSSLFGKLARPDPARIDPEGPPPKRLASGFAIRFFLDRMKELLEQWHEYEELLPDPPPRVQCVEADSRDFVAKLERAGSRRRAGRQSAELAPLGIGVPVDAFVMSPPYPGVLDYADYHLNRLRWLGLPSAPFERAEIGSRRSLSALSFEQAAARWEGDLWRVLRELRKIAAPGARFALVSADSMLAGQPYLADEMLERCAEQAGLDLLARGSQRRPHFHRQSAQAFGTRPRYEHLVILGAE